MKTNINLQVIRNGYQNGTLGWLCEFLNKTQFKISKSRAGNYCVYFKHEDKWKFVCRLIQSADRDNDPNYECRYGLLYQQMSCDEAWVTDGLFPFDLTEAAKDKWFELLDEFKNILVEISDEDDSESFSFEIVKKSNSHKQETV